MSQQPSPPDREAETERLLSDAGEWLGLSLMWQIPGRADIRSKAEEGFRSRLKLLTPIIFKAIKEGLPARSRLELARAIAGAWSWATWVDPSVRSEVGTSDDEREEQAELRKRIRTLQVAAEFLRKPDPFVFDESEGPYFDYPEFATELEKIARNYESWLHVLKPIRGGIMGTARPGPRAEPVTVLAEHCGKALGRWATKTERDVLVSNLCRALFGENSIRGVNLDLRVKKYRAAARARKRARRRGLEK